MFALKTLCGFSVGEIALRLFTSEANVYKRLARARDRLREIAPEIETPPLHTLKSRLPSVQAVLYLLFNEGYLSAHGEEAIRRELCDEAIRLATLLAEHPIGAVPETFALLALMHLHAARLGARRDALGGLLLLEEQNRSLWDRERMRLGAEWLARSASGEVFSRFHAEAGIAAEQDEAIDAGPTRRLGDPRVRDADDAVREGEPPVHSARLSMCRNDETDVHRSRGRLEPRSTLVCPQERICPLRQITGLSHELEHLARRGHDLNTLNNEHAHNPSPHDAVFLPSF